MKEKVWRSKGAVFFSILIVLLPFAQFFINGLTAIALTNDSGSNVRQLFDNEYGKASLSYQTNENEIIWQLNIDKESATKATQFLFSLKDKKNKSILPTLSEENQATDHLTVISKETEKDYATVFERKPSNTEKNYKIEFSTPVVSALTFKVAFNAASDQMDEQTTLFTKEYPINIKENDETQTSTEETMTSATKESNDGSSTESSATGEETTSEVKDLGDADEATVDSAKKDAEKKYEETGVPQKITRSAAVTLGGTVTPGGEIPKANELVISNTVDNPLNQVKIVVDGTTDYTLQSKNGAKANYGNLDDYKTKVFTDYGNVNGAKSVVFKSTTAAKNATITITYPNIGTYNKEPVGAKLTIKNIIPADKVSWTELKNPVIDVATSLYSGMVYDYIKGMDISFQFIKDSNPIEINKADTFLTFASLNYNDGQGPEFVFPNYDTKSYLTKDTALAYGKVPKGTRSSYPYDSQKAYYGRDWFDDNLAAPGYVNGAVSFNIDNNKVGNGSTYTIGSLASRSWTSFMSSVLVPIDPGKPNKTVTENTNWKNRTKDELDNQILNDILTTSPKKHSYFINQPLYSSDESIGRPDTIQLIDELPEYVKPVGLYVLQENGEKLNLTNSLPITRNANNRYDLRINITGEDLKKLILME